MPCESAAFQRAGRSPEQLSHGAHCKTCWYSPPESVPYAAYFTGRRAAPARNTFFVIRTQGGNTLPYSSSWRCQRQRIMQENQQATKKEQYNIKVQASYWCLYDFIGIFFIFKILAHPTHTANLRQHPQKPPFYMPFRCLYASFLPLKFVETDSDFYQYCIQWPNTSPLLAKNIKLIKINNLNKNKLTLHSLKHFFAHHYEQSHISFLDGVRGIFGT